MKNARTKLVGKTIAAVEMHPFRANPDCSVDRRMAHDPVITFTDGTKLRFVVQETEIGVYGVDLLISIPPRKQRKSGKVPHGAIT